MARIEDLTLHPIGTDVANAIVTVDFEVRYNVSDRDANTPYRLDCVLVGHDGGELTEDGIDDVIPDGALTPIGGQVIRADGDAAQPFEFHKTLARAALDEDIASGVDEIKAKVTLKPIMPKERSAESNVHPLLVL